MIDVVYTLEEPEYIEAQKLFIRLRVRRYRTLYIVLWALLLIACFAFFASMHNMHFAAFVAAICVAGFGASFLAQYLLRSYLFKKRFKTEKRLLSNVHISIGESGVTSETPGIGHGTSEWPAYTGWTEGSSIFLLIVGYLFRPIPKRVLSEGQRDELVALLENRIGPKNTKRNSR